MVPGHFHAIEPGGETVVGGDVEDGVIGKQGGLESGAGEDGGIDVAHGGLGVRAKGRGFAEAEGAGGVLGGGAAIGGSGPGGGDGRGGGGDPVAGGADEAEGPAAVLGAAIEGEAVPVRLGGTIIIGHHGVAAGQQGHGVGERFEALPAHQSPGRGGVEDLTAAHDTGEVVGGGRGRAIRIARPQHGGDGAA